MKHIRVIGTLPGRWELHALRGPHKGDHLGTVYFSKQWCRYVFEPKPDTVYSKGRLWDIAQFITECTDIKRAGEGN